MNGAPTVAVLVTAPAPGAIAVIQLHGPAAIHVLTQMTGERDWPAGRMRLTDLAGIDRGLAVALRENWAQLMVHGGTGIVRQLLRRLGDLGAAYVERPSPRELFPEADSALEADMLWTLSVAASPAAADLLLAQPALWRQWLETSSGRAEVSSLIEESRVLDRLVVPATVAVVGQPSVGKSTLSNAMIGRSASIVADMPGTTRDWVGGLAELEGATEASLGGAGAGALPGGGVVVQWVDTPGVREAAEDRLEASAIALARQVMAQADVLIAMRDPTTPWPASPRAPDLWVMGKADLLPAETQAAGADNSAQRPLPISARSGVGMTGLRLVVLRALGLDGLAARRWAFSQALRESLAHGDLEGLRRYAGLV